MPCAPVWCGPWLGVIQGNMQLDGCTALKANHWEELTPHRYVVRGSNQNYNLIGKITIKAIAQKLWLISTKPECGLTPCWSGDGSSLIRVVDVVLLKL